MVKVFCSLPEPSQTKPIHLFRFVRHRKIHKCSCLINTKIRKKFKDSIKNRIRCFQLDWIVCVGDYVILMRYFFCCYSVVNPGICVICTFVCNSIVMYLNQIILSFEFCENVFNFNIQSFSELKNRF